MSAYLLSFSLSEKAVRDRGLTTKNFKFGNNATAQKFATII